MLLDVSWGEMLVIGVVALVVVGPKDLPKLLRVAGQTMGKVRRMAADFQGQVSEAIREAELEDVKKTVEDLQSINPVQILKSEIDSALQPVQEAMSSAQTELNQAGSEIRSSFDQDRHQVEADSSEPLAAMAIDEATPEQASLNSLVDDASSKALDHLQPMPLEPPEALVDRVVPETKPENAHHASPAATKSA